MKEYLLHIVLFFCFAQQFHSQEGGVVAFNLPIRNSLKFNRYAINPTFTFVREQNKYISFTNKRQWVQFDNAPQTYLFSYAGRFKENVGAGVAAFQQDYGVLTTFGGVLNFAYNAVLSRDSNLTFGMNLGVYKSGLNSGKVITNFDDSSLNNIPSNTIFSVNPGINYGTGFIDFGVSINNLVSYNLQTSKLIEDNPEQSIQGHIMYTGYINSRGFFDESKFSGLVRSEFKKDKTVLSAIMMLTVPKGIWAQTGYNTLYGVSAGIGLNITNQISLEYNYEKAMGNLLTFGNSHEITLAYKFKNVFRYDYSGDDDEQSVFNSTKKPRRIFAKSKPSTTQKIDRAAIAEAKEKARLEAVEKLKVKQEARAKLIAEAKEEALAKQKLAEEKAKAEALAKIKLAEEQAEQKRLAAEAKAKEEALAKQKLAEEKAKAEALAKIKLAEEQAEQKRLAAEAKAKEEALAKQKLAEEKAKAEALAKIKLAEEQAEQKRLAAETKAKEEALAKQKLAEEKAKAEALAKQKLDTLELDGALIKLARDKESLELKKLIELTENSKIEQQDLLIKLKDAIDIKQQDLDNLKEENDLSEQGIVSTKPKVFKSISAENKALEVLTANLDNLIKSQDAKLLELENLYNKRLKIVKDKTEATNVFYQQKIQELKSVQSRAIKTKASLLSTLEVVKVATEFERKRRIKRASYDNKDDQYRKDRASLDLIKKYTPLSKTPLTQADFDFGEELNNNIKIIKGVSKEVSGYYLVIAVHSDVAKRDEFLRKVVASGQKDINFFFDVNTSKYYIYYNKFDYIDTAKNALESKENKPYNSKMSIVKIEN